MRQFNRTPILPAMLILCTAWSANHAGEPLEFPIGQRQLFLDDRDIERIENVRRTMHQPVKRGAVIKPELAWETALQVRCAPVWDPRQKLFKIWMVTSTPVPGVGATTYAQSEDGITWTKPILRQWEYQGSLENNFVCPAPKLQWPANAILNVVYHPDAADPNRRFKGFLGAIRRQPMVSPDGIRWKVLETAPLPSNDESNLSYDKTTRTFIATLKTGGPHGRAHAIATSSDFESWTKPRLFFSADDLDQELGLKHIAARFADARLQQPVANDPSRYNVDVYNIGVFRYESMAIGLAAMYHATGPSADGTNTDGFHLVQLAAGRDLKTLHRLGDRKTFIGPSPVGDGAFDLTQILPPSNAVVHGDELWFYYTGLKYRSRPENPDPDVGAICLAVLRRDGFISFDAADSEGIVQTRPFVVPGGKLHVNADVPNGRLIVELLGSDGKVVGRSAPIKGDHPGAEVQFGHSHAELAGKVASLQFRLMNGSIYSYWFE
jgi:hypothetical protein